MMVNGSPYGIFERLGDAARMFGISPAAMYHRIQRGTVVGNVKFRYEKIGEELKDVFNLSPKRKARKTVNKQAKFKSDDVELDGNKYTIVPYKVRNIRECITRCVCKEFPQPFVGSVECARCPSFRGRNKNTHEVACANSMRRLI